MAKFRFSITQLIECEYEVEAANEADALEKIRVGYGDEFDPVADENSYWEHKVNWVEGI